MQQTPRANRTHIGIFGRCNVGKSSLLNALADQQRAVVSSQQGTTTDPVYLSMELLPLGPVVLIDTPGLDDTSLVGEQRKEKTRQVLAKSDLALLVIESSVLTKEEQAVQEQLKQRNIPYLLVQNKIDLGAEVSGEALAVSARTGAGVQSLKERLAELRPDRPSPELLEGLVQPEDLLVLVTPIDTGAPKGRLILPQQQAIRDILDNHAMAAVTQPEQLVALLDQLSRPPALVITDSQVFGTVGKLLPEAIPLTSFSILFARKKGILEDSLAGVKAIAALEDGARILVAEGCSHHRQCEDIGTCKIPRWLQEHTGHWLDFTFTSGGDFPEDLASYQLIVHCGGCMLGDREVLSRLARANTQQVPMTNYGILISFLHGTLGRSVAPLGM